MELRKIPGTWFDSRSTWLARTEPRRAALLAHWNVNDSSFPVRIVNAALQPWLPFLGATVDPSDVDQLCLEQHHLEFYFLGAFVASDVNVRILVCALLLPRSVYGLLGCSYSRLIWIFVRGL